MADNHTPSSVNHGDPFADHAQHLHFEEPTHPFQSTDTLRPYQSSTNLSLGRSDNYDDDYIEKQPLNAGQNFTGGFYPPGFV